MTEPGSPATTEQAAPAVATDPTADQPVPEEARLVANSTDFTEAVAIALMRVVLDGSAGFNPTQANLARHVVQNPSFEAGRFAVALATDPAIVAAAAGPEARTDPAGLTQLVEKIKVIWPVMAGDFGPQVVDHREVPNTGKS